MDIQQSNNFRKLKSKLRKIKYPVHVDLDKLAQGMASEILPMINYILMDYSPQIANMLIDNGYDLYGKKDFRFMESVFKLSITMFKFKPAINLQQFFNDGFAEQKFILV